MESSSEGREASAQEVLVAYFRMLDGIASLPGKCAPAKITSITWAIESGPSFSFNSGQTPMFFKGEIPGPSFRLEGSAWALCQLMFSPSVDVQALKVKVQGNADALGIFQEFLGKLKIGPEPEVLWR